MAENRKRITRRTTSRATVLTMVFGALAIIVAIRLAYLQVYSYDYYKEQVMNEITMETEVNPERGTIYDTNGNILATNATVYLLEKTGKKNRRYEVIANQISEEDAEKVRKFIDEYELTSQIYLRAGAIRYYPYGDLAAHTLGFTNSDGIGIYGLEAYYNNLLEGTSGRYVTAQDALNNDMGFEYETYVAAEDGYDVVTNIDTYIQYELENQLEATVNENQAANRAAGIVMNVNTGAILGMATYPSFDCNDPYTLDAWSGEKLAEYENSDQRNDDAYRLAVKR